MDKIWNDCLSFAIDYGTAAGFDETDIAMFAHKQYLTRTGTLYKKYPVLDKNNTRQELALIYEKGS